MIAHRGSSGSFPEHSLGAYSDAYFGGADFIDVDLQVTKDGHLVAQHDPELNWSTNIADYEHKYVERRTLSGMYLVRDFTLAELRTLNLVQRFD